VVNSLRIQVSVCSVSISSAHYGVPCRPRPVCHSRSDKRDDNGSVDDEFALTQAEHAAGRTAR
jgi:hypothetical protein